jgi:hypothetical protein
MREIVQNPNLKSPIPALLPKDPEVTLSPGKIVELADGRHVKIVGVARENSSERWWKCEWAD